VSVTSSTHRVPVVAVEHSVPSSRLDEVAVEEPLEIRVAGDVIALTMRTPGEDRFLALGFLFAEGVIAGLSEVGSIYTCGRSDGPGYGNAIEVTPGPGVTLADEHLSRAQRRFVTSSACGVCGRDSIDDLLARCPRQTDMRKLSATLINEAPRLLALGQPGFQHTGGLHAACAIRADGQIAASAEDIGRHNAVDKVVGKLLFESLLPSQSGENAPVLLCVSGRASFEIVQKACMAGFRVVASISAPSSLAIETAEASGLTLASFVREGRFTLYTHPERVI